MEKECKQSNSLLSIKGVILFGQIVESIYGGKNHPKGNTSEVNKEKTLYVYAMMENIKFDVGETIETSIWMNNAGKHKLGHLTLIF